MTCCAVEYKDMIWLNKRSKKKYSDNVKPIEIELVCKGKY